MDLAKLKKLEAKASPAPWWQDAVDCEDGHGHYKAYCVGYEHKSILDTANSDVQLIEQDDGPRYDITGHYDTEFIAEMRNATPELIARVQDLELIAKTLNSLSVEQALRIEALEGALKAIFARLDHPGNGGQFVHYFLRWPEVEAARKTLAGDERISVTTVSIEQN